MIRLLEPQTEKFREGQILLRTSGYCGHRPLIALTIDPDRGSVWYTDGTSAGTSLPKILTTAWNWYLIDLENGCCYKGTQIEIQKTLYRSVVMSGLIDPWSPFPRLA